VLPDSLTARASFTHGFPHYPYPNLPMTLRSVVNRCTNSEHILPNDGLKGQGFGTKESFTFQSGTQLGCAADGTVIDSMMAGSTGTFVGSPVVGSWPMASMVSVPPVTVPSTL
jgi:hypothetical protein